MDLKIFDQNLNDKSFTKESHKLRDSLLLAIQNGDQRKLKEIMKIFNDIMSNDRLKLKKRVVGDELRSYKNLMLSHNSLYGYVAEKGGLHPLESHYMTEKNSMIIEYASSMSELTTIHDVMVYEYADLEKRHSNSDVLSLTEKVAHYIHINFMENDTVSGIADIFSVNPSHLMRQFKKEFNVTITQYRNNKRIHEAKKLLSYSNLTITDIAFMVGFNTSQYFSKTFKKETKTTPYKYRQMSKDEYNSYR